MSKGTDILFFIFVHIYFPFSILSLDSTNSSLLAQNNVHNQNFSQFKRKEKFLSPLKKFSEEDWTLVRGFTIAESENLGNKVRNLKKEIRRQRNGQEVLSRSHSVCQSKVCSVCLGINKTIDPRDGWCCVAAYTWPLLVAKKSPLLSIDDLPRLRTVQAHLLACKRACIMAEGATANEREKEERGCGGGERRRERECVSERQRELFILVPICGRGEEC